MVLWNVNPELHHVEFADTAKISVVHHFSIVKTITQCIREEMEVGKVPFILKYEFVLIMKGV